MRAEHCVAVSLVERETSMAAVGEPLQQTVLCPKALQWCVARVMPAAGIAAVISSFLSMLPAPVAPDERERLAALRQLHVLDTPPEPRFNVLVESAAHMFDVPIARKRSPSDVLA
jgi:hypothetical protein